MELRDHINLVEASTRPAKLETTPLPYGVKDLEPVMKSVTTQEKAMRILIVLAVFYTISSSLSLGLLKLPTVPAVQYLR